MFSRGWGVVNLPAEMWITLAAVVWMIYAIDRIIDTVPGGDEAHWEARHWFHRKYRKVLIGIAVAAGLWSAWASVAVLSQSVFTYAALVGFLVAQYFLLAVRGSRKREINLVKNLVASLAFSFGVASAAHAYAPFLSLGGMLIEIEIYLLAALCFLNISAIDFWSLGAEEEEESSGILGLGTLFVAGTALWLARGSPPYERPFFYAVLVGAGGLYLLNRARHRFSLDARRVMVDLVLFLPPVFYWVWMRYYEMS